MSDLQERSPQTVIVREDQMVFVIPSAEEGVDEIVYVDNDGDGTPSAEPINLAGAWVGLVDGDALLDAIDRIGHESPPSPIASID